MNLTRCRSPSCYSQSLLRRISPILSVRSRTVLNVVYRPAFLRQCIWPRFRGRTLAYRVHATLGAMGSSNMQWPSPVKRIPCNGKRSGFSSSALGSRKRVDLAGSVKFIAPPQLVEATELSLWSRSMKPESMKRRLKDFQTAFAFKNPQLHRVTAIRPHFRLPLQTPPHFWRCTSGPCHPWWSYETWSLQRLALVHALRKLSPF